MSLPLAIVLVAAGLAVLVLGGEMLVRAAVALARVRGVSPAVVGLTVVAMATSLPELAVSLLAAIHGSADVAVANVVGSNIFNVAAILGVSALVFPPLRFRVPRLRFDVLVMILAAGLCAAFVGDGTVSRPEGVVLLVGLVGFLAWRIRTARLVGTPAGDVVAATAPGVGGAAHEPARTSAALVRVLAGAALLAAGADVFVRGAVALARLAGLSERVIGLTLVSAGTGLPELVTAVVAGVRRHTGVGVGNVIGSNIFNVFGILGIVSLVRPVGVAPGIAARDVWVMLGVSMVAVVAVARPGRTLSRIDGMVALAAYGVYLATLL